MPCLAYAIYACGRRKLETYAWHDPLVPASETNLTEEQLTRDFNQIMEEASPDTTADSFEDFLWTNDAYD